MKVVAGRDMTVSELEALVCRLTSQRDRVDGSLAALKQERQEILTALNHAQQLLNRRRGAVKKEPSVSTHALLRYIERVLGVDIAAVEREILTPANVAAIRAGATRIRTANMDLIVKDQVVITVVD